MSDLLDKSNFVNSQIIDKFVDSISVEIFLITKFTFTVE